MSDLAKRNYAAYRVVDGYPELVAYRATASGAWAALSRALGRKLHGGFHVRHGIIKVLHDRLPEAQGFIVGPAAWAIDPPSSAR